MTPDQLFFISCSILLLIAGILLIKYLNGDFSYDDTLIYTRRIVNRKNELIGTEYTFKRIYHNGRIKYRNQKLY